MFYRKNRFNGVTKVIRRDFKTEREMVIAVFGKIRDLTNAKIIQWCDTSDDQKYIIIFVEQTEKKGPHQNGPLYTTEDECIAECEAVFLNAIFI